MFIVAVLKGTDNSTLCSNLTGGFLVKGTDGLHKKTCVARSYKPHVILLHTVKTREDASMVVAVKSTLQHT